MEVTSDGADDVVVIAELKTANEALRAEVTKIRSERDAALDEIDEHRGASRSAPIRGMDSETARKFVFLALLNLGEAVRHVAEAFLSKGGNDDMTAVATRAKLNVSRAAMNLDGRVWEPPRDSKDFARPKGG